MDPNGLDTNDGLTAGTAWRTLDYAVAQFGGQQGEEYYGTLVFAAGTYRDPLEHFNCNGLGPTQPLTFRPAVGAENAVLIRGSDVYDSASFVAANGCAWSVAFPALSVNPYPRVVADRRRQQPAVPGSGPERQGD